MDKQAPKILVVDDDNLVRRQVGEELVKAGYTVLYGSDGNEALTQVRDVRPDLLIMDVQMPGIGGREACRIIKGNKGFGFIPVILMTSSDDIQVKVTGLEIGADDFLIKPLNWLELLARVKSMLRMKTLQDELVAANDRLRQVNEHLHELSTTDALTGLYNRLFFQKRMLYEFQRANRYRKPLSVLLIDIDHFKRINDQYGHLYGDMVLRQLSAILRQSVRETDILARYGGEEIVVICPEAPLEGAVRVADRLRANTEKAAMGDEAQAISITISIGVAQMDPSEINTVDELLQSADTALYKAKAEGRNCVRQAFLNPPSSSLPPG